MKLTKLILSISSIFIIGCNSTTNNKDISTLKEVIIDTTVVVHKDSLVLTVMKGIGILKKNFLMGLQ